MGEDDDIETDNDCSSDSGYDNSCTNEEHSSFHNCTDCQYRRQIAVLDSLPDAVVQGMHRININLEYSNWNNDL